MAVCAQQARAAWGCLETVHVVGFFAPQVQAAYDGFDVPATPAGYFGARAAALGECGPGPVVAAFYVFAPRLVRAAVPTVWAAGSPRRWAQARADGVAACLREVLGPPEQVDGLEEAVDLAERAAAGLTAAGRPLYGAWSGWDRPTDPLLRLWHAGLLLREHRGDGHVAALMAHGLDPVEALVTGGLASGSYDFVRSTRGWSAPDWAAGLRRLRGRGLVEEGAEDDVPVLTEAGRTLRERVEATTDQLALEGWAGLGEEGTVRLTELLRPVRRTVLASGVLPDWVSRRG